MKTTSKFVIAGLIFLISQSAILAQSVFPGKQTIDKKEYLGLNLNSSVAEKNLTTYWEDYLNQYGKVKGKRGNYTIEKAFIPAISGSPVGITSQVTSTKGASQVFLAVSVSGNFLTNPSDSAYKATENLLKDFSAYSATREEVRVADESYSESNKNHAKLVKDEERLVKDIEKAEKKLVEMKEELEKGKVTIGTAVTDMQTKLQVLEASKAKVPASKK